MNIPLFKVFMPRSAMKPLRKVLMSGFIGQGQKVEEFEGILKNYFKNNNLVTVNTCTSGLHQALRMVGVTYGSEVVTTPLTCFATNAPILANGGIIKWADVDPDTCNISVDSVLDRITDKTKAVVLVHWGGYPVDTVELREKLIRIFDRKIPVIEDCAHAFGATINGGFVGTNGNFSAFSLQAIKHITTVDGGILFTPPEEYKRAKLLRWYGIDREEKCKSDFRCEKNVSEWGYKFHMNDVCATIGIEQMRYVEKILKKHRVNARYYNQHLKDIPGIELLKELPGANPSYWLYTFKVDRKSDFMRVMAEKGIVASKVHERNDIHSCLEDFRTKLPLLDSINDKIISIPVGWWVGKEEREYIVDCIKKGW